MPDTAADAQQQQQQVLIDDDDLIVSSVSVVDEEEVLRKRIVVEKYCLPDDPTTGHSSTKASSRSRSSILLPPLFAPKGRPRQEQQQKQHLQGTAAKATRRSNVDVVDDSVVTDTDAAAEEVDGFEILSPVSLLRTSSKSVKSWACQEAFRRSLQDGSSQLSDSEEEEEQDDDDDDDEDRNNKLSSEDHAESQKMRNYDNGVETGAISGLIVENSNKNNNDGENVTDGTSRLESNETKAARFLRERAPPPPLSVAITIVCTMIIVLPVVLTKQSSSSSASIDDHYSFNSTTNRTGVNTTTNNNYYNNSNPLDPNTKMFVSANENTTPTGRIQEERQWSWFPMIRRQWTFREEC